MCSPAAVSTGRRDWSNRNGRPVSNRPGIRKGQSSRVVAERLEDSGLDQPGVQHPAVGYRRVVAEHAEALDEAANNGWNGDRSKTARWPERRIEKRQQINTEAGAHLPDLRSSALM